MKTPIKTLFFSRGRGYGHAIPDLAIARILGASHPEIEIQFVSYATGAEVFRRNSYPVIDLELSENNPFLDTLFLAEKLIERENPDVVIAHEEFAALPAARRYDVPAVFISAWLPKARTIEAEALALADAVIVLERPGIFPIPAGVKVEPCFTGAILREMSCGAADRARLREKLKLEPDATVILVVSGGWANEERAPIADLIFPAFDFLNLPEKHLNLIWLAGNDCADLNNRLIFAPIDNMQILDFHRPIEEMIVAADLVITKGTRGITLDCAALGVPSLSLSHGLNPIDDILVPRIRSNLALDARAIDVANLGFMIEQVLAEPVSAIMGADQGGRKAGAALGDEVLHLALAHKNKA